MYKSQVEYERRVGEVVGEYVPTDEQLICLTCSLKKCNGERACMTRQRNERERKNSRNNIQIKS
jgi:hypothetical protein